ncbi:transposase [Rhizobium mesosinicum]|uniref:Transposase n=1 Tax=Rhizobium mesosinicum TaxID=335017 RepID=A0ABS7H0J0_9HYPH|nr:transposase [Rhizobium mesosinicum]
MASFSRWQHCAGTARLLGEVARCSHADRRKKPFCYDQQRYRARHLIEKVFCRLKDFRRIATRYDEMVTNFLSAVSLATMRSFWL